MAMYNSTISRLVDKALDAYQENDIPNLQNLLYHLYSQFNRPGGGEYIINFPSKDKLSECFTICLIHDWINDSEIREVWAEDSFYCITEHISAHLNQADEIVISALNLFNLLHYGGNDLKTKFNDILTKGAILGNDVFSQSNYAGGADNLIREFKFFAATIISPIVARHPQILYPKLRQAFEDAKTDFCFAVIPVEQIILKMKFISRVIGSILADM